MNIEDFNRKYKKQGGIGQLSKMRSNLETLTEIAECFRVSKERVRQWMIGFFGESYDPRYERRQNKIKTIAQFLQKYGKEKTKKLYPKINKEYLKEAIKQYESNRKYNV